MKIVGIHGIAQEQLGRRQLENLWRAALLDGIDVAGGTDIDDIDFRVAFYGDLFLDEGPAAALEPSAADDVLHMDGDEMEFVEDCLSECTRSPDHRAAKERHPHGRDPSRSPRSVLTMMQAIDRRLGAGSARFFVGTLRQTRRFLRDQGLRDAINDRVESAVADDTNVVIAHSLGSVVGLEFIRRASVGPRCRFVTLGSPLALRGIQENLKVPWFGRDSSSGLPPGVGAWHNVRDPRDPVAFAGPLVAHWRGVAELQVDNGDDPHAVLRYLGKRQTGAAILGEWDA